jgi:hypothetical protein
MRQFLFCISGKVGLGKSSLISFIEGDIRTKGHLWHWSGDRALDVLKFFFWRPSSVLPKSISGLLRSMLHQLLRRSHLTIDDLCAEDASLAYSHWTFARLLSTSQKAFSLHPDCDHCVFILIESLEEYEGDYLELLRVVLGAEKLVNVKSCLSSRPEVDLRAKLGSYLTIRLEDLNYQYMKKFVDSKSRAHGRPHQDSYTKLPSEPKKFPFGPRW